MSDHSRSYVQAALDRECEAVAGASVGRNEQLNRSSFSLAQLAAAGLLEEDEIRRRLYSAAETSGYVAKDGAAAARSTIESGLAKGRLEPRSLPEAARSHSNGHHHGDARAEPSRESTHRSSKGSPPKLSGVALPDWTPPDAKSGKPQFRDVGAAAPSPIGGELRRHEYRRDGQVVRVKAKRGASNYVDMYRVRRPADGAVGWQAKKPAGWVPVPYIGGAGADDPFSSDLIGEPVFWPEGEKDVDTLQAHGFLAFTFGGSSDVPEDIAGLVHDREVIVAADNDEPGRKCLDRKLRVLAGKAARVRAVQFLELADGGDISDWLEATYGGQPEELWERVIEPPAAGPGDQPRKPGYVPRPRLSTSSIARWIGVEPDPIRFAVDPIIPRGVVTVLSGDGGAGKTLLMQTLMTCVASGQPFLGLPCGPQPAGAVGIFGEDPDKVLHARQLRICKALGTPLAGLVDTLRIESFLGTDLALWRGGKLTDFFRELEDDLASIPGTALTIVDCSSLVFAGNENDRSEVATFMSLLNGLASRLDIAIVLLVHTSKTTGDDAVNMASGSTAWIWQARSALALKVAKSGGTEMHHRKANLAKKIDPIILRWSENGILEVDPVALQDKADVPKGVRLGRQAGLALRSLRGILLDRGEPAPASLQLPHGVTVARYEWWRADLAKMLFEPGQKTKEATVRKAVQRVKEELLLKNVIGFDDPYVWIAREPNS